MLFIELRIPALSVLSGGSPSQGKTGKRGQPQLNSAASRGVHGVLLPLIDKAGEGAHNPLQALSLNCQA